jgi:hypothetical protein
MAYQIAKFCLDPCKWKDSLRPTGADKSPSLYFSALGTHPVLLADQTLLGIFDSFSQWEDIFTDQHVTIAG